MFVDNIQNSNKSVKIKYDLYVDSIKNLTKA